MTQLSLKFSKAKRNEIKFTLEHQGQITTLKQAKIEYTVKDSTTAVYLLRAEALKRLCKLFSDTRRASGFATCASFEVRYTDNIFHTLVNTPNRIKFAKKSCQDAVQVLSSLGRGCFTFIRD